MIEEDQQQTEVPTADLGNHQTMVPMSKDNSLTNKKLINTTNKSAKNKTKTLKQSFLNPNHP
jgi:hypothetical protein